MGKGRSRGQGTSQPGAVVSRDASANIVGSPNVCITFQNDIKEKSVLETYILALAVGFLGAHHFYLGRTGFGLAYMFTFGLLGFGYVVDLFRVPCLVADTNWKLREPSTRNKKSLLDAYILWFPFGILGFHHFYLRKYGLGILYVLTLGVFGIGWIVDAGVMFLWVEEFNHDVSEYNNARDDDRRIATNFLSSQPPGGAAVISATSTSILPPGGITGSVMQPPPQAWNPGPITNYPPQENPGGVHPVLSVPAGEEPPPSYMDVMGGGSASYHAAIPKPQST